jgi:cytidylate kinase
VSCRRCGAALGTVDERSSVGYQIRHPQQVESAADGQVTIPQAARLAFCTSEEIVRLDGRVVTDAIRTEGAGNDASKVAALPAVRAALLERQRRFAVPPGLVADGRDMGTVIFPKAEVKIFLTASAAERALRRHKQLKEKGVAATLAALSLEIEERDRRDMNRAVAPLVPSADAVLLDTTGMSVETVVERVLEVARGRLSRGAL